MMVAESVRRKVDSEATQKAKIVRSRRPETSSRVSQETISEEPEKRIFVPYLLVFWSSERTSVILVPGRARYL